MVDTNVELMKEDDEVMSDFPTNLPTDRSGRHEEFWNQLKTLDEADFDQIVSYAMPARDPATTAEAKTSATWVIDELAALLTTNSVDSWK